MNPFEQFDLSGKKALVTGGATGLGFRMARALGRAGAKVLIVARRDDVLAKAADELRREHGVKAVEWRHVDLHDRASIDTLAAYGNGAFGGVDIMVGNAGSLVPEQLVDLTHKGIDDAIQLNLTANMHLARAFLPGMRDRRWGRFLFSSSIASNFVSPLEGNGAYAAAKAGLNAFARSIAADLGRHNITANSLVLGLFVTDILEAAIDQLKQAHGPEAAQKLIDTFTASTATGRLGKPSELEGIVQLLASEAGSYITGQSIPVDGGMSIMMRPFPQS